MANRTRRSTSKKVTTSARRSTRQKTNLVSIASASDIASRSGDLNFMASFARGLTVIRAFSKPGQGLTISEISHDVDIPRAAVRRCLYTLEQLGYVTAEANKFSLKPKILTLGYAYFSSNALAASAQAFLDRVSLLVHESCSLATLSEDEILYVARSTMSKRIMSIDISVGTRLPSYCSSMGRVLLAHLSPAELDVFLARVKLQPYTEKTVTAREKLRHILDGVRRADYAVIDQELEIGLRSIAVPVRNSTGKVVAAMNIGTQAARVSVREMETTFLPHLRAAAQELGMLLPA